jgi:hypothetical protein
MVDQVVVPVRVISQNRDGWDLLLYWTALAASATALMTFASWLLEQRKRPEAKIQWQNASRRWIDHNEVVRLDIGVEYEFLAIFDNVGRASGPSTLVNLGVPLFVDVWRYHEPDKPSLESQDPIPGLESDDHRVNFLADTREWAPGMTWMYHFVVRVREAPAEDGPFNIVAVLANDRFGRRKSQLFPSHFAHRPAPYARDTVWPGDKMTVCQHLAFWTRWHRIRVQPWGQIRCEPGERKAVMRFDANR